MTIIEVFFRWVFSGGFFPIGHELPHRLTREKEGGPASLHFRSLSQGVFMSSLRRTLFVGGVTFTFFSMFFLDAVSGVNFRSHSPLKPSYPAPNITSPQGPGFR